MAKSLESQCVNRAVVLVGEIARWKEESPGVAFWRMCVTKHQQINEATWMDEVPSMRDDIATLPRIENPTVCLQGSDPIARRLEAAGGILIQNRPVLVAAVVDPGQVETVRGELAESFSHCYSNIVLVSPHTYSRLLGLASIDDFTPSPPWNEDLVAWASLCGLDPNTFFDINALVEEIWVSGRDGHQHPVSTPGWFSSAAVVHGTDAAILWKSRMQAWVATPRPLSVSLKDSIIQATGLVVNLIGTGPNEYNRLIGNTANVEVPATAFVMDTPLHVRDWGAGSGKELYGRMLDAALGMRASDIHLEPKTDRIRVRFRIDGTLQQQAPISTTAYHEVIRQAKLQGKMMHDIQGEFQDGAGWITKGGNRYDLRMSVSVLDGGEEACVIRIFNSTIPHLHDLKLPIVETRILQWFLAQNQGMLIASGPTGSGKTTLLYALLKALAKPEVCMVTIEQPVEKNFPDARQITVYDKGTKSFTNALKFTLRQDPDIIMVGEIRDIESCKIAIQAAQTGHLVLSTLHANDVTGIVQRMVDAFDVDRVSVGHAMRLGIAQRLVPRLCPICKHVRDLRPSDIENFPSVEVAAPVIAERQGCPACRGTGIMGRQLIMELLPFDDVVREMVATGRRPDEIADYKTKKGFLSLLDQATALLLTGEITLQSASQFLTRPLL